jgi:hypothetical protein
MPSARIERINILLRLDVAFNFNRTKLTEFLKSQELIGYSRSHLYKLLGNPVLSSEEYNVLNRVFERIGKTELLPLIISQPVAKKFFTGSLGT